jgi:hypothetical protein
MVRRFAFRWTCARRRGNFVDRALDWAGMTGLTCVTRMAGVGSGGDSLRRSAACTRCSRLCRSHS